MEKNREERLHETVFGAVLLPVHGNSVQGFIIMIGIMVRHIIASGQVGER